MSARDVWRRAGRQGCSWLDDGTDTGTIEASAHAMKQFGLSGKEAQAVGVGAVETLCPAHDPLPAPVSATPVSTAAPAPVPNYEGPPSSGPVSSKLMRVTLPAGTTAVGVD